MAKPRIFVALIQANQRAVVLESKLMIMLRDAVQRPDFRCGCATNHRCEVLGIQRPQLNSPSEILMGRWSQWSVRLREKDDSSGRESQFTVNISKLLSPSQLYRMFKQTFTSLGVEIDHP